MKKTPKTCEHCARWEQSNRYPKQGSCDYLSSHEAFALNGGLTVYGDSDPIGTEANFGCVHWTPKE